MADERDEALTVNEKLANDVNQVGGDPSLNKQQAYDRVQALYDTARGQIAQLRAAFWQRMNGERQRITQSLMAPNFQPAGATSAEAQVAGSAQYLDCLDRASAAAEKDGVTGVRRLLQLAGNIANRPLEQACFVTALGNIGPLSGAWNGVIDEFLSRYPAFAADVDALRRLDAASGSAQFRLQTDAFFSCRQPLILLNPRPTIYAG
jgi:hypothetical protein